MPSTPPRSTNHLDYQRLPQTLGAMAREFESGFRIAEHSHERHQLLYAIRGVMRLSTANEVWVVPGDRAVFIPASTRHSVEMCGAVSVRTLYIDAARFHLAADQLRVISVTPLVRELITALSEEPVVPEPGSRGVLIAQLLELELQSASAESFSVPLPTDPRLQRLCAALLADPADNRTLERWSEVCGASARTLSRLCERELGMSFRRWRQLVRFHSAIEALARGEPIAAVARNSGYRSPSAFSAAFHDFFGQPPSTLFDSSRLT